MGLLEKYYLPLFMYYSAPSTAEEKVCGGVEDKLVAGVTPDLGDIDNTAQCVQACVSVCVGGKSV